MVASQRTRQFILFKFFLLIRQPFWILAKISQTDRRETVRMLLTSFGVKKKLQSSHFNLSVRIGVAGPSNKHFIWWVLSTRPDSSASHIRDPGREHMTLTSAALFDNKHPPWWPFLGLLPIAWIWSLGVEGKGGLEGETEWRNKEK